MGKWMDALKNMPNGGFVSFGSSTETHFSEKKPSEGGFVSFGSSTEEHFREVADAEIRREGIKRLKVAAHGLPVDLDELLSFFADDLQDIAAGAINPSGLQQAVKWFVYSHLKRTHKPVEPSPQESGMVRCVDCKQSNCRHGGRQTSPTYRWCSDYNKAWRAQQ